MTKKAFLVAQCLYEHIPGLPVFHEVVSFMTSSLLFIAILCVKKLIEIVRRTLGNTSTLHALPATIRFTFAENKGQNCVHALDSKESFLREVSRVASDFVC